MVGNPPVAGGHANASMDDSVNYKKRFNGIAMTTFSAFGGVLFGYDTGVISGIKEMQAFLRQFGFPSGDPKHSTGFAITSSSESLIVSILSAGTFIGALLAAPIADNLGRKWGIILATLVFSIGIAMQTAASELTLFVIGRVFAGLGVGISSVILPMYQAECSPRWIRGAVIATYQFAITIGLLTAAIVNNATKNRDNSSAYQIPIALQFGFAVILAGGMMFLPESPRWLIKCGRDTDAALSLSRLTGSPHDGSEVESELEEIRVNLEQEKAYGRKSYKDCFRHSENRVLLRTLTGISLQAWQQLTGINFIFYYGTTFFQNTGINNPFIISIVFNAVNVLMTMPGIWGVERYGRRRLLLVGAIGMCLCEYIVAIIGATISVGNIAGQKVLIAVVCIYISFFAATWGPIPWVITGELFPLQLRAKGMSLSIASNWLCNFGISYAIPYLVNKAPGSAGLEARVFFIWGSMCFCCIIFTFLCVPETKGLSLEQIDVMYRHATPVQSLEYRRRLMASIRVAEIERAYKIRQPPSLLEVYGKF
ncbi:hypothetical protein D9619_006436 [Psilocybe cf. subviscida]|uniref:Major facilitator superfamily (MFS) profile domain-containing protein n=1 Tax=Psilocybe cf. subviscida TaxID=2480587 RepID=A0A8H5EXJ1_9AGAR|nr:hypothetical protein D9619_006436 [Psilocybe cf. subviscida]